ncbi:MAG: hypothetical protein JJU29_22605 [Verrucomicrobia bacterium]|nr:hypothetical protein [Verrucomicrobiota bacterium]MCH8513729.1 hypothetical protein [Kiritimatiellia bacterium]
MESRNALPETGTDPENASEKTDETHGPWFRAHDTLMAAASSMPTATEVVKLRAKLEDAIARGYFTPAEDEEIRRMYARYLHVRAALHETVALLRPHAPKWYGRAKPDAMRAFVLAWCAGCMLMRPARYLIGEFYHVPVARKLLNQSEPRFGIPENSFSQIHRSATRPQTVLRFLRAARFAELHAEELDRLRTDPIFADILGLLDAEKPFVETQKRKHAKAMASYGWGRLRGRPRATYHKVMWGIFEASGRAIAEMRNPFHRKRVNAKVRHRVSQTLQPCDILVTRHDDALSNLFLPGFWPHAALVIGHEAQRQALGLELDAERVAKSHPPICILEAKKDGVRFRALRETLHVDAFVLLRPKITDNRIRRTILEQAISHEGKLYDFEFDFNRPGRLVCTEVVYRGFDGQGDLRFALQRRAGRHTLSAEDLLKQGLASDAFEVVMLYGVQGNRILYGDRARELLERTL